jgi:iron complex outermembrane receptor protein
MNLSPKGSRTIGLRACCVIATLFATAFPAVAQDQEASETVVVTGSRIRQNPLNQAAPVITVSDQDIQKSGLTSVGDLLQRMPVSGGAINTRFNTSGNIGFPPDGSGVGAGATTADLRHLGSKRVLVLVDGIRWVNESSASGVSSATDLNTIPTSIIDHIEVLQDGASSIYGSDAIGGVINIITRKSFDGIEFSGYGGGFDKGDGNTQQWSVSMGSASDRMKTFFSLNYADQRPVGSGDRAISSFPTPGLGFCTNRCSSGTPQGRFFFTDPNTGQSLDLSLNDGVTSPTYNPADPASGTRTDSFHDFTTADRFNFQPFNEILTPNERIGVYGQSEYRLTDNVSFYMRGLFNQRRSNNRAAPEPLFIGPEAGNGNLMDTITVDVTNPYNPLGFTLNASTDTATGGTDYFIGRRPLEGGPRLFEQNVDTWYLGGGFKGDFRLAERDFYWDLNAVWSRNDASQTTHGSYNSQKLKNALGPAGHDSAGDLVCGVPDGTGLVADPIPGCVPFNIFGGQGTGSGTITQAMLDYIRPVLHDTSEQELKDVTANLGGTIVSLPAGGLDFAIGYEHRKQSGFYEPDHIYTAGESAGVPSSPTSGEFDVNEFYGEIQIPLLRDRPGADLLQLTAALRSSDYSTFGSTTTGKYGLNWRPFKDLLLRGSYAEGFRAPGIGELFGTASRFDTTIADPCSDYAGVNGGTPQPAAIQANCQALGVPNTYQQINAQISVITGGNPDLKPEPSDGYTFGLVYAPGWAQGTSWSDGLTFELTHYKIDIKKAISAIDAQVQLDGCVTTLDPSFCGSITRTAGGVINRFSNQLININGIDTKGWDLNIRWQLPQMSWGRLAFSWQNSRLTEFTDIIPTGTGFAEVSREGTERGDPSTSYPRWKSTLTADWSLGDWGASLTGRYISSLTEACRNLGAFAAQLCSDPANQSNTMDSITYVDAQATWRPERFGGNWSVTLGVNNLLDQDPPFCFSCALNSFDGSTYDVPGVFWYGRVVAHFGKGK